MKRIRLLRKKTALEAYSKFRKENKAAVLAHRKLRSVHLGENFVFQFESETTIRYQIQEMLRIEKVFDEEGIQQEIDAYAPTMASGATNATNCPGCNRTFKRLRSHWSQSPYLSQTFAINIAQICNITIV